ncbi:MAG: helix-hairpin-helix domain-containing protein [Myxococcota bacterium]
MTDEGVAGLFHRLEGKRSHYLVHLGDGRGTAALVHTREPLEQIVRTVLGWLDPATGGPLAWTGDRFEFTLERETLDNGYAGRLVEPNVLHLGVRSRSAGRGWTSWSAPARYARLGWPAPIDLDTADEATLRQLPGITALRARRLLDHRAATGTLSSAALERVPGLGPKVRAGLARWVVRDHRGSEPERTR